MVIESISEIFLTGILVRRMIFSIRIDRGSHNLGFRRFSNRGSYIFLDMRLREELRVLNSILLKSSSLVISRVLSRNTVLSLMRIKSIQIN